MKRPDIPRISVDEMAEVDRLMIEDYKIGLIQMMENAGRNLAHLARERFLDGDPRDKRVVVLAGGGGNGGGALVATRRLHNWGAAVEVCLAQSPVRMNAVPRHQLEILEHMNVPVRESSAEGYTDKAALILDGLIGYSLRGAPRGTPAELIRSANDSGVPILALDVPSGLDATTGEPLEPTIRATATLTLALPKSGLETSEAVDFVGELYLADISIPPELYARLSASYEVRPIFSREEILRLR